MSFLYIRGDYETQVRHGTVVSMGEQMGVVLLDHHAGSVCFDMKNPCTVGLGEMDWNKGLKFSSVIDIPRPARRDLATESEQYRIVLVADGPGNWLWAYEAMYLKADSELKAFRERERQEKEDRERQYALEAEQFARKEEDKRKAKEALTGLGFFRISQAHKFDQEKDMRPRKPWTGPMELGKLVRSIANGVTYYQPETQKGANDTLHLWFEQADGLHDWVKVEITNNDIEDILDVCDGLAGLSTIQPLLDRLSVGKLEAVTA